ncbi:zinc ribbon domain-containing protein [Paenibacillus sp. L3-i20]|uniref:zinc ribbon domain-containing protein n=1 Tax=Paenibacillus sp. L3-i20 TaxID=2905833 RepID=UPI001EDE1A4E|nr:zinc ribbon domain-containing protein [Paenibacillus sp. L3-i20]GKU77961.1 hypothetical protein L3i20_v223580 [Paenibacillus sp. L3-i20]
MSPWIDIGATAFVLLLAIILVGAMFLFIRVSTDDSDKYKVIREMVETIFGTPAHLRAGQDPNPDDASASQSGSSGAKSGTSSNVQQLQPFREQCPACGEEVTEQDINCPACELRLL